jgi:glycogen synthase
MNILLTAHRFSPDVGGTKTAAESMAQELSKAGHKVVVITQTPGEPLPMALYQLVRRPNARRLLELYQWCDVVLQITLALRSSAEWGGSILEQTSGRLCG